MNEHRALESLIPWYVNGTLPESDQDRLNRHLEDCQRCREQVQREIEFSRAICERPTGLAQVGRSNARAELLARVAAGRSKPAKHVPLRAMAAACFVAVAVLFVGVFDTTPAYRTLTTPASGDQPVVQILFEPSMGEQQIRDTLAQLPGAQVLNQPATGLYRLTIDEAPQAEHIAERARQLPGVRWADVKR